MTTVQITSPAGGREGSVELPDEIFDATANVPLMHQVVVAQLAAARTGNHKTKTRGEVSGGGKKPYRQKGTGRARQGSTRAPQFNGGGTVHGPVPHGYAQRTPKKMKAAALRGALSDRARGGNVHVLSSLVGGDTPSTKTARKALAAVSTAKNILVVLGRDDVVGWLSLRNVPEVHLLSAGQLNTYDVLVSDEVVFTREALEEFLDVAQVTAARSGTPRAETPKAGRHAADEATGTESTDTTAPVDEAADETDEATEVDVAALGTGEATEVDVAALDTGEATEVDVAALDTGEATEVDVAALDTEAKTTAAPTELELESGTAAGSAGTTAGASSVTLTPDSTSSEEGTK